MRQVTANALGSGVNGPQTAQAGLTLNISKDNWWTGGMIGEIDGLNVLLRQNGPGSDASGILINVQNQGNEFLSATEFASTIVDPVSNTLTHGIDSSSPCSPGQLAADQDFMYVCVAPNHWKRSPLSPF